MNGAKRRPGRPKGSGNKKPKVRVTIEEVAVSDDQQVGHVSVRRAVAVDAAPEVNVLDQRLNDLGDSWETESLFQDAIEDLAEDRIFDDVDDACKPEEAVHYRQLLRKVGPVQFCKQTVQAGLVSAKKLLTAFGIRPPAFLEGAADHEYLGLLTLALSRELSKRAKLLQWNSVDDAVFLLQKSKNIIVLTGAGISTSLGIPDFRSKETGLYSQLDKLNLGINDAQEVFNIDIFREDPNIFYSVAKDILPATKRFSPTHAFIAMLQNKGKLLTNYSQNIDNIEANAGIKPEKLVQCHGSFATASCQKCGDQVRGETIFADIKAGKIPRCQKCVKTQGGMKRKRSHKTAAGKKRRRSSDDSDDDEDYDIPAGGVMKPDITFFGEDLPVEFNERLIGHDRDKVDLVIVIGTSLKVSPVSEVVPSLPSNVPQIYISKTPVNHINFDIDLLGDCDVVVAELCRRAGWELRHEMIPPNQTVMVEPEEGYWSRYKFTSIKDSASPPAIECSPKRLKNDGPVTSKNTA